MAWQDITITTANIILSIALFPQIYHGFRKKVGTIKHATSIPTFISIYAISIAFWSLSLFFSSIITFITGTMWLTLFIQRLIYPKIKQPVK